MTKLRQLEATESTPYRVVEAFCRALLSGDGPALAATLAEDFRSDHPELRGSRERFVGPICEAQTIRRILTPEAEWRIDGLRAVVGPLILYTTHALEPVGAELTCVSDGTRWLASGVARSQLPRAYRARSADTEDVFRHEFALRASDGSPVAARVSIVDAEGEYWPPFGHAKRFLTGWNEDVGGDVLVRGRRFAYVQPDFFAMLPLGSYVLHVERGPEHVPTETPFQVASHDDPTTEVHVPRWVDMRAAKWYSGDTHVHHMSPHAALLEARGEDLDVVNLLAAQWSDYFTDVEHFVGGPALIAEPSHVVYVSEESRHTRYGHTSLLNLKELIFPMAWGQRAHGDEGTWEGHDFPAMADVADQAHEQGGLVVWAHIVEGAMDGELAVDAALGRLDAAEVLHLTDPFHETTWADMPQRPTTHPWYRLLNAGFDVPAVAGTDKMYSQQVIGSVRVYAHVDGPFDYEAWLEAIRRGRTFVTTGPMLDLRVDGKPFGGVHDVPQGSRHVLNVSVESLYPVDWVEIICNGEAVARFDNSDQESTLEVEYELLVEDSLWVAARAYAKDAPRVQELPSLGSPGIPGAAHTSATWFHVDGVPVRCRDDVQALLTRAQQHLAWVETEGHFRSPAQQDAVAQHARRAIAALQLRLGET